MTLELMVLAGLVLGTVSGGSGSPGSPESRSKPHDTPPLACDLGALDAAQRSRHATLLARIDLASRDPKPSPNGWAFRLGHDATLLGVVAEWIPLEARCCPFLAFDVKWDARDGGVLTLSGGPGVKRLLDAMFER